MENTKGLLVKEMRSKRNFDWKEKSNFFALQSFEEIITVPDYMPDIKEIVSMIIEPEIISQKIVDSIEGISMEGEYLSGKKIIVHMKLKQKILYGADLLQKSMHTVQTEDFQSVSIVIPQSIEGTDPKDLLKFKYLKTKIQIQELFIKRINSRTILKNAILLVNTFFIPTYQLAYTLKEKNNSNIFICYTDGSHKKQITFTDGHNIKPLWSYDGCKLAFLSDRDKENGQYMLYVYSLKDQTIKKLTDYDAFHTISSFCWNNIGEQIIFSASFKNEKQLFCIDINTLVCKQFTFGNSEIRNYKPKISPTNKNLVFLQSISSINNLCLMDMEKMNIIQLTSCGFIKDFTWNQDGKKIAYVLGRDGRQDELYIVDLVEKREVSLKIPQKIMKIRKIRFSPTGKEIGFVGGDFTTENIFFYEFSKKTFKNITTNFSNIKISDFVWKIDGTQIYYAANDLTYYNIYLINLKDATKYALTTTTASDIRLSYRRKII